MTNPSYTDLRKYHQRVARMLADPDLVGELLLVGIAYARAIDLGDPPLTDTGCIPGKAVAAAVYGQHRHPAHLAHVGWANVPRVSAGGSRRLRDVLRSDIRRYQPTDSYTSVTCGRPMVRREGLCGRAASDSRRLVDPATGERFYVGACTNTACKAWLAAVRQNNRRELAEHPPPTPPANTGGVLARHLDEIDWHGLWSRLDDNWSPPPEDSAFHRPKLTVLVTDEVEPVVTAVRPALRRIDGGWR